MYYTTIEKKINLFVLNSYLFGASG